MSTTAFKIFGIGLSKTGTTSLAHALDILGFRTKDYPGITHYRAGDLSSVDRELVDSYDALTDTPIPSFYRELDVRYPGSKFILTVREKEGWLKSCRKQFNERSAAKQNDAHNQLFMDLYGCKVFDEHKFLDGYERFVDGVLEYFKDRPNDLLVINVTAGEGWKELCRFLGQPLPEIPFPKANVTQITWMNINDIVAVAKRAGQIALRAYRQGQKRGVAARLLHTFRGGDAGALKRATHAAHVAIEDGLKKLNATTPILSREGNAAPYAERAKWNHIWLVDPLDGAEAFLGAVGEFTVNIALIQDGSPIYGVVYAPVTDTVYYARVGKGAFKAVGAGEPERLDARENTTTKPKTISGPEKHSSMPGSRALTICCVAEGQIDSCILNEPSQEWETAAAHLVATTAGKRMYECTSKQGLKYNKEHLVSECVIVESASSAMQ
jgi:3'-phosphoadenosine 5'-phosphosulfate (PAPS) 3'-phosphatase